MSPDIRHLPVKTISSKELQGIGLGYIQLSLIQRPLKKELKAARLGGLLYITYQAFYKLRHSLC